MTRGPLSELVTRIRAATTAILDRGVAVGAVRDDLPSELLARMVLGAGVAE